MRFVQSYIMKLVYCTNREAHFLWREIAQITGLFCLAYSKSQSIYTKVLATCTRQSEGLAERRIRSATVDILAEREWLYLFMFQFCHQPNFENEATLWHWFLIQEYVVILLLILHWNQICNWESAQFSWLNPFVVRYILVHWLNPSKNNW